MPLDGSAVISGSVGTAPAGEGDGVIGLGDLKKRLDLLQEDLLVGGDQNR